MIRRLLLAAALAPTLAFAPSSAGAQAAARPTGPFTQTWAIDKSHSEMTFKHPSQS